ncbi:MAG: hypothetical protein NZ932_00380 [Candidatus Bathyarchaeota archaeon]|nr:hypothetical protein [Candidatus Bathyarchaeota archaeon]MDW8040801.1 hypothetical protein [Nitrososphaerota archaeon]
MKSKSLKDSVVKAIDEYNKYRSPEARAKLVRLSGKELILDFEGSFCSSCGVYDYLEDFIYELQKFTTDVSFAIESFREYKPETIRVKYSLKRCNEAVRLQT